MFIICFSQERRALGGQLVRTAKVSLVFRNPSQIAYREAYAMFIAQLPVQPQSLFGKCSCIFIIKLP
jgi:hypothetical protein